MNDDETADSGHDEHGDDAHGDHDDAHAESGETRQTSPMQAYGTTQVTTGAVILLAGLLVTFGLAFLLV